MGNVYRIRLRVILLLITSCINAMQNENPITQEKLKQEAVDISTEFHSGLVQRYQMSDGMLVPSPFNGKQYPPKHYTELPKKFFWVQQQPEDFHKEGGEVQLPYLCVCREKDRETSCGKSFAHCVDLLNHVRCHIKIRCNLCALVHDPTVYSLWDLCEHVRKVHKSTSAAYEAHNNMYLSYNRLRDELRIRNWWKQFNPAVRAFIETKISEEFCESTFVVEN